MPPLKNPNQALQENVVNPDAITSASLAQTQTPQYTTTQQAPAFPIGSLIQQQPATDPYAQNDQQKGATDLMSQISSLNNQLVGKDAYTADQQAQNGYNDIINSIGDYDTQIKTLHNQQLNLQNQANYTIPNQMQLDATGRGVTAGGLAPITTAELRRNQIQQGGLASQALFLSAASDAANNRLGAAQRKIDAAVQQKFGPLEAQQKALTQNLELLLKSPAYSLAEKKQAQTQLDLQNAKTAQIEQQKENVKTAQAMAAAAVKLNAGNQQVNFASQQVAKLDPSDPQYLAKAFQLVGQYQTDPNSVQAALLDMQMKQQQIAASKAGTALDEKRFGLSQQQFGLDQQKFALDKQKTQAEITALNNPAALRNSAGKPLTDAQATALGYAKRVSDAGQIIDQLGSQFTGAESYLDGLTPNLLKSADKQKFEQAQRNFVTAVLRKESGAAIAETEYKSTAQQYFPQPGDTAEVLAQKKQNRDQVYQNLLTEAGNPQGVSQPSAPTTTKSGASFDAAAAKAAGYTDDEIRAYLASH